MNSNPTPSYLFDRPGRYQIRVWGTLDETWISQLHDLKISVVRKNDQTPVTKITGWLADQSALAGLLELLNDLGLVLIAVRRLEPQKRVIKSSN